MSGTREIREDVKHDKGRDGEQERGTGKGGTMAKERQRGGKRSRFDAAGREKASIVRRSEIRFEGKGK